MGFANRVADRIIFMDEGQIVEQNDPESFIFKNPESDSIKKLFLSQILESALNTCAIKTISFLVQY